MNVKLVVTIAVAIAMFTGLTASANYQLSYASVEEIGCLLYCPTTVSQVNDCGNGDLPLNVNCTNNAPIDSNINDCGNGELPLNVGCQITKESASDQIFG